jgi:hypothetical protein
MGRMGAASWRVEFALKSQSTVRGEFIALLKLPAGMSLPKHHHTGTVRSWPDTACHSTG